MRDIKSSLLMLPATFWSTLSTRLVITLASNSPRVAKSLESNAPDLMLSTTVFMLATAVLAFSDVLTEERMSCPSNVLKSDKSTALVTSAAVSKFSPFTALSIEDVSNNPRLVSTPSALVKSNSFCAFSAATSPPKVVVCPLIKSVIAASSPTN